MVLIIYIPIAECLDSERRWSVVALVTPAAITVMVTTTTNSDSNTSTAITAPTDHLFAHVAIVQRICVHHPDVGVRGSAHPSGLLFVQRRRVQRYGRRDTVEQLGRFDLIHRRRHNTVSVRVPT